MLEALSLHFAAVCVIVTVSALWLGRGPKNSSRQRVPESAPPLSLSRCLTLGLILTKGGITVTQSLEWGGVIHGMMEQTSVPPAPTSSDRTGSPDWGTLTQDRSGGPVPGYCQQQQWGGDADIKDRKWKAPEVQRLTGLHGNSIMKDTVPMVTREDLCGDEKKGSLKTSSSIRNEIFRVEEGQTSWSHLRRETQQIDSDQRTRSGSDFSHVRLSSSSRCVEHNDIAQLKADTFYVI